MSDDNVAHQIINNCIERSMTPDHINIEKEKYGTIIKCLGDWM